MANGTRAHIGHALHALAVRKEKKAVTMCEGRVRTGAELVGRVAALASALHSWGLQRGDRVAIAALNSDFYLEWLLAVPCAGGIICPLNCRWSTQETSEALQQIEPSFLVIDHHFVPSYLALESRKPNLGTIVIGALPNEDCSFIHAEYIIQLGRTEELRLCWAPNAIALICFTSGTSGRPKGVAISHNALVIQSLSKITLVNYSSDDVYLHNLPLCHIGGISSAHAMIMAGGCHVFLPRFHAPTVLKMIKEHGVSAMTCVPTMLNDLVSLRTSMGDMRDSFPSVSTILNGAGSLSTDLLQKTIELFPSARIISTYGMTEACSSISFLINYDPGKKTEIDLESTDRSMISRGGCCVGRPAPHIDIIVGERDITNSCLFKEGNVFIRGPQMMDGYWEHLNVTEAAFNEDGWFDTGDVGWTDEEGRLWMLGRKKDVIKSGGETVYSFEVENILSRHPSILAVTVLGVPDTRLNEAVAAIFLLREGWKWEDKENNPAQIAGSIDHVQTGFETTVSPISLQTYCLQQGLSRYKVPRLLVKRRTPFPLTSTGKVKKDLVRKELLLHLTSQVADFWHSKL